MSKFLKFDLDYWEEPDASAGGGGSAVASGGGSVPPTEAQILDWTKLNTTESLIKLFEDHEMSSIDLTFGFCVGIHSDSNIETAYDEVSANPSKTLGAIFAGITETKKYNDTLMANQWLKVWLTEKFISTYGESIIMDVYAKYRHLLGKDEDIDKLHAHVLSTGITISFDMHGELNIQPRGTNVYTNVIEILGGTLPNSSLLHNPSIFDETAMSTKSYEEIMEKQRQITIKDLQNFIVKRDACRQTVGEISNKISEYHYKILELQNSLDATASQEMTQSIQNASQVIVSASQVIDQANSIVEHISANNGIELPPQIASTPTFSPGEELADLRTKMNNLYYDLGAKITKLDELVKDVKDTYISLRSILYYNLSNPQAALRELDQTLFSGTNEEDGGLGIVLTLGKNKVVAERVRYYLRNTFDPNITFGGGDGLTITKKGPKVDAYNPSGAMILNTWNFFINSKCGRDKNGKDYLYNTKYPSFAWLFMTDCVLRNPANQGAPLPLEAIKVLTMTLFDDCTHGASDNIISEILRTKYRKGNTTDIKSELLYSFLETLGIKYSLNLLHCMGKPSTESIEVFKTKVKYFVGTYIGENIRMPFDRRIAEIGATQTLGSQESMPSQIDFFNNAVDTLSQMTQQVSTQIVRELQTSSQPGGFKTLSISDLQPEEGVESATGGGYDSDDSLPFNPKYFKSAAGGGNAEDVINAEDTDDNRVVIEEDTDDNRVVIEADTDDIVEESSQNSIPLGQPQEISKNSIPLGQRERNQYCHAFLRGQCPRGKDCPYPHIDPNENKDDGGSGVCSEFHLTGTCSRYPYCRLSHYKGGGSIRTTKRKRKGGRKTRRPKKNKRTRRTKGGAKYTRKR